MAFAMQNTSVLQTVNGLLFDLHANKLRFDYKYQRAAGQWKKSQKSELIDSILKGYPINIIHIAESTDGSKYIVDGVQRANTILEFHTNKFKLGRDLSPISELEFDRKGKPVYVNYEIANKTFEQLDPPMKQKFLNYQFTCNMIQGHTPHELREMFRRFNNATPMNNSQKNLTAIEDLLLQRIAKLLEADYKDLFWNKLGINKNDFIKANDRQILLQSLYAVSGEQCMGFKNAPMQKFLKDIQDPETGNEKQMEMFNRFHDIVDPMIDAWEGTETIVGMNKMSIPCMIGGAVDICDNAEIVKKYALRVQKFFAEEYATSKYALMCKGSGTAAREPVMDRIQFFKDMADAVKAGEEFIVETIEE